MKFTLLGTGTSTGVPTVSCQCDTCTSTDPKDKRLRCSLLIESENTTVVIDTSADFRQQMMTHGVKKIDAVLYTHQHFDHIGGFDDLRAYNFTSGSPVPIFINNTTFDALKRTFSYAFGNAIQLGGGLPQANVNIIDRKPFSIGDIDFQIIPMMHGKLEVLGFRIGNFAYCTDTNFISDQSMARLEGLDVLILDALRYHKHPTHFTVDESLEIVEKLKPKQTYFTHIAHQIKHSDLDPKLPDGVNLGYDNLTIEL
jgi:phosphoribosyl 1,2-cyclic phosphate phosphodiesterase